jgi:glycosyltransferase involved in cell wall biosynthesis
MKGRPMRIAMISSLVPPVYGGAGTQAVELGRSLTRSGVEVEVLTANQALAPRYEVDSGIVIRRMPGERLFRALPRRLGEVLRTLVFIAWIATVVVRRRYDVLHVHGCYWFALGGLLGARLTGASMIVKVTQLGGDDAATLLSQRFRRFPVGRIAAAPLAQADLVIALNAEIARRQLQHFPTVPVACLPNGVDVGRFTRPLEDRLRARQRLDIPENAVVALFVGYLSARKGVLELLDAWSQFAVGRGPSDPPARLLLVGPEKGVYTTLSDEARERAMSAESKAAGVQCLSHIPWTEMPELYATADVFVLPTKAEGMPNSLLEALAAGVPTVTTYVPGVSELLAGSPATATDSFTVTTAADICRAFEEILSQPKDYADRRTRIPEAFTVDHVAQRYVHFYRILSSDTDRRSPVLNYINDEIPAWP